MARQITGTPSAARVLALLKDSEMNGSQIIQTLESRYHNIFQANEGTLYPLLHTLERNNLITAHSAKTSGGHTRRCYRITPAGLKALEAEDTLDSPVSSAEAAPNCANPSSLSSNDTFISQGKRNRWLDDATRDISCKADRTAVRLELLNHITDRAATHSAAGLHRSEALNRAVEDMGDARALRPEFSRIHRPFWGRAHWITRLIAIILAFCVLSPFSPHNLELVMGMSIQYGFGIQDNTHEPTDLTAPPNPPRDHRTTFGSSVDTIEEYTLTGKVRAAGHTLSIPAAWVEQQIYYDESGQPTTVSNTLVLYIKASTPLLFGLADADRKMISQHLITDSDDIQYSDRRYREKVERVAICTPYQGRLGTTWYRVRLGLGNHETPDQLEIPIGYGDLVLHADLEKGVLS